MIDESDVVPAIQTLAPSANFCPSGLVHSQLLLGVGGFSLLFLNHFYFNYRMGINFRRVLIFVDFVGLLHLRKSYSTLIFATMHAVAICHENINPQNRLTFSNHKILTPRI